MATATCEFFGVRRLRAVAAAVTVQAAGLRAGRRVSVGARQPRQADDRADRQGGVPVHAGRAELAEREDRQAGDPGDGGRGEGAGREEVTDRLAATRQRSARRTRSAAAKRVWLPPRGP